MKLSKNKKVNDIMFKKIISTITLTTKRIVNNISISDITEFFKISDTIQIKKSLILLWIIILFTVFIVFLGSDLKN